MLTIIIGRTLLHTDKRLIECNECPYGKPIPYKCKYGGHQGFLFCCTSTEPEHNYCAAARWACDLKTVTL